MRTVTHNTIFLTGASIIQKALSFVFFAFLARTFSSTEIGSYSFALASTTLFAIIVDGGLTPVLIRHTAGEPRAARKMLRNILWCKALLAIVAGISITAYVLVNEAAGSVAPFIGIAGVVMLLDSLNLSLYGVLRGSHDLLFESLGMVSAQLVSFAGVVLVMLLGAPIIFALVALGVGSFVNFCVALLGTKRFFAKHPQAAEDDSVEILENKKLFKEAAPFALAGLFARGYSYLDVLMIGSLTNLAAAGTYSIANKLTFAFQFVPLSLSAAIYPAFAKDKGAVVSEESKEVWLRSMRYLLGVSGFIVMILIALRLEILGFFGKDHTGATAVLAILSMSLVCAFLSYPVGALLNARGLQKFQTIAMGCTLAANIGCNIILIPRFGAVGAAVSALVGNIVLFGVGAFFVSRRVSSMPWNVVGLTGAKILGAGVIGSSVIFYARGLFSVSHTSSAALQLAHIALLALIGLFCYLIACAALGVITREELQKILGRLKTVYESITRHT